MITFQREILTRDLIHEMLPLLEAHWKEVGHYEDIPLDVDVETYLASESAGIVRCFTARTPLKIRTMFTVEQFLLLHRGTHGQRIDPDDVGGELVGYAVFFVRPNPHYKSSVQAAQDVLYLDPAHRGKPAYTFIRWCDEQLQAEGVQAVYHHSKAAKDFGKLLMAQGYELVDLIYAKRLDDVKSTEPEMGQDWKDQAEHDYDTARFMGHPK